MAKFNIFIFNKTRPSSKKRKKRLVKKWIRRFIKYYRKPSNEFGFMVCSLARKSTGFPAYICIDDGGLWINIGHKKIFLFQVNNDPYRDFDKIIPMSIEDKPEILVRNERIDLNEFELEQIRDFSRNCQKELIQIADNIIDHCEFFERIKDKGFINL